MLGASLLGGVVGILNSSDGSPAYIYQGEYLIVSPLFEADGRIEFLAHRNVPGREQEIRYFRIGPEFRIDERRPNPTKAVIFDNVDGQKVALLN